MIYDENNFNSNISNALKGEERYKKRKNYNI